MVSHKNLPHKCVFLRIQTYAGTRFLSLIEIVIFKYLPFFAYTLGTTPYWVTHISNKYSRSVINDKQQKLVESFLQIIMPLKNVFKCKVERKYNLHHVAWNYCS